MPLATRTATALENWAACSIWNTAEWTLDTWIAAADAHTARDAPDRGRYSESLEGFWQPRTGGTIAARAPNPGSGYPLQVSRVRERGTRPSGCGDLARRRWRRTLAATRLPWSNSESPAGSGTPGRKHDYSRGAPGPRPSAVGVSHAPAGKRPSGRGHPVLDWCCHHVNPRTYRTAERVWRPIAYFYLKTS